ncbi:MAG: bifunctional adenosylcobinamide kinase/adenosylcobinamide-phosphate guanylyltransferase [Ghiorsea sp.]|nr:bifunctional adenosylcobinamide kinase/adenosylcobinamide-phosphate guanylyltransferase [Ghiorsea sp.]
MKTLILGGARSGKSKRAEALAQASGKTVVYVATSPCFPDDKEWQQRINQHQTQRPTDWVLLEEELSLINLLHDAKYEGKLLLIDCLTLWLSNLMFAKYDVTQEVTDLCQLLASYTGDVILVSNEVGLGLVPETSLGRDFRDQQGRLNQQVAAVVDCVEFIAAGLPIKLKGDVNQI